MNKKRTFNCVKTVEITYMYLVYLIHFEHSVVLFLVVSANELNRAFVVVRLTEDMVFDRLSYTKKKHIQKLIKIRPIFWVHLHDTLYPFEMSMS